MLLQKSQYFMRMSPRVFYRPQQLADAGGRSGPLARLRIDPGPQMIEGIECRPNTAQLPGDRPQELLRGPAAIVFNIRQMRRRYFEIRCESAQCQVGSQSEPSYFLPEEWCFHVLIVS